MMDIFDYLSQNFSHHFIEEVLHTKLDLSKKALSGRFIKSYPWQLQEIKKLSKITGISTKELIISYGLGHEKLTLQEVNALLKDEGEELGIISHAA